VSIINRRNAVLGWGIWQVAKRTAKVKAKGSPVHVQSGRKQSGRKAKPLVAATFAGVVGAVAFWRKRRGAESS
jgi:hypothetical protein